MRTWLVGLCLAQTAYAQFTLSVVSGGQERPAGAVYDLGAIYPGESVAARFRLRNVSSAAAAVQVLAVGGTGFVLSGVPALPRALEAGAALDFSVVFGAVNLGTYSAALVAEGISVILTATVSPRLTYTVDSQFGSIERGSTVTRRVRIENRTPFILTVPAISVAGSGFRLAGLPPSGTVLRSTETSGFDIEFAPASAGPAQGTLQIGDRSYTLEGSAFDPPLPLPSVVVSLAQAQSARQGTVTIRLDAASRTSGTGTLTLEFQPAVSGAADPAIAFSNGSRTVGFTVAPGDTQPVTAAFQTGTTAGTLVFAATLGGVTDRQTVSIAPAPVAIASAVAARSAGGVELRVTAFDNMHATGAVAYTFYDAAGTAIAPGAIRVDSTAEFARFFEASDGGGNFLLRSVFPVTGDPARIASFEVVFTTPAGTATTGRTPAIL